MVTGRLFNTPVFRAIQSLPNRRESLIVPRLANPMTNADEKLP